MLSIGGNAIPRAAPAGQTIRDSKKHCTQLDKLQNSAGKTARIAE